MDTLGFTNCPIQLRFNTGVARAKGENKRTLTLLQLSTGIKKTSTICPVMAWYITHIRCLSSRATPSNLSLTIMASNLAPQPSETSTQLCARCQAGAVSHASFAGDSRTLSEAHQM